MVLGFSYKNLANFFDTLCSFVLKYPLDLRTLDLRIYLDFLGYLSVWYVSEKV